MFGMMRPSSISSLEQLETERPFSKITKDDSLSIYESTLAKLRKGSMNHQGCPVEATDCSSSDPLPYANEHTHSLSSSTKEPNRTVSVSLLFSRYKSSRHEESSPHDQVAGKKGPAGSSPTSSDVQQMPVTSSI